MIDRGDNIVIKYGRSKQISDEPKVEFFDFAGAISSSEVTWCKYVLG